jgi:hypothetical protein
MTKLPLHGLRSRQYVQDLSAEDRKTYRRWARGSCAVYAIVLAVLFAGFWLHDRTVMVAQSVSEKLETRRESPNTNERRR